MPGGQASLGEGARARPPPTAAGATGCGGPGASAGAWEWPCRSAVVTSRHWPPPPRSATGRPASRWLGAALGDQAAGGPRPLRRRRSAAARQPPAASWGGRSRRSALLFWCLFPTVTPGRRRGEQHSGRALPTRPPPEPAAEAGVRRRTAAAAGGASAREPPLRLPCAAWWLRDQAGEGDAASGLGGAATQRHLPAARVCHLGPPLAVPPAPVTGSREEEPSLLTPIKLQARGHEWWWWFRAFPSLEVLYSATGVTGAVL